MPARTPQPPLQADQLRLARQAHLLHHLQAFGGMQMMNAETYRRFRERDGLTRTEVDRALRDLAELGLVAIRAEDGAVVVRLSDDGWERVGGEPDL
jgi:hypothetical protein